MFPNSFSCGGIHRIVNLDKYADCLKTFSGLALTDYSKNENTKLEFVKVVKANSEGCAGRKYYITFDIKDSDAVDSRILTFQALVWDRIYKIEVLFCRLEISN